SGRGISGRAITWRTSDPAVATVDANGLVTAAGVGSAGVTATSEGVDGSATITVIALQWLSVSANTGFTCGVTSSGAAYCWGDNSAGQLGIGTQHSPDSCSAIGSYGCSTVPVAVIGGLSFSSVTGWGQHGCGLSTTGAAYCWGDNPAGQLGIGTTDGPEHCSPYGDPCSTVPVAVSGGLTFSFLSVGGRHACGLTTTGAAYCWGFNSVGQLGDGSNNSSSVPV